ncbi:MAG: hypothetical protein A4E53_04095 [Pelotomaculum sp. PtaB.Bin104]|nr:MAG: hypothetical protein A4E53_04095 [Pelotomaculum sp. PtaB.Bin104]
MLFNPIFRPFAVVLVETKYLFYRLTPYNAFDRSIPLTKHNFLNYLAIMR